MQPTSPHYLIDTHCHLNFKAFSQDAQEVILRARAARVGMVVVGTDLATSKKAVELANVYEDIWATVGYHPIHEARFQSDAEKVIDELSKLAENPKVVAVGEIGLDYFREPYDKEAQKQLLMAMLNLGKRVKKPVIVHSRQSLNDLVEILDNGDTWQGVVHCYEGNWATAEKLLKMGFYIGFTGLITFSKDEVNREVVKRVPIDRFLVETDSPYLTPIPKRGERNEPINVLHVAEEIARIKGVEISEIAKNSTKNARDLFGI